MSIESGAVLAGIVVVTAGGLRLWWPARHDRNERAGLGSALLTGAAVAGALFLLQNHADNNRRNADKDQATRERQIAQEQESQQRALAAREELRLRVGL